MRYRKSQDTVTRHIGGETLLVPITHVGADLQKVYLLNETAAAVWELLDEPRSSEEVAAALLEQFEEDTPGQLQEDVAALIEDLLARGFVEPVDV